MSYWVHKESHKKGYFATDFMFDVYSLWRTDTQNQSFQLLCFFLKLSSVLAGPLLARHMIFSFFLGNDETWNCISWVFRLNFFLSSTSEYIDTTLWLSDIPVFQFLYWISLCFMHNYFVVRCSFFVSSVPFFFFKFPLYLSKTRNKRRERWLRLWW